MKELSSHALLGPVTGILVTCVSTRATVCADRYTARYDVSIELRCDRCTALRSPIWIYRNGFRLGPTT